MNAQHIRIGLVLLLAQLILLGMTLGFQSSMDRAAERDGISNIIEEVQR